jgi:hypothetical protein
VRGIGKTADLAFQYQGGIGAWRRLAPSDDQTPDEKVYGYRRAWVRRHPNIEKFWATSVRQASGGRWEWYHVLKRRGVFGGLIAENATQALCRDIFVEAMLRLEAAGYHIVAHLHDEFICEVPEGFGDLEEFRSIITTPPTWAPDFPVAAKARIADRFIEVKAAKPTETKQATADEIEEADEGEDDFDTGENSDFGIPPIDEPRVEIFTASAAGISEQEPASPMPPPWNDLPPPEFDYPPPRGNGDDSGRHAGNGYATGEQPRGAPTARYIYKDARGLLYMRVLRTSSKSFPTQHWQDGRWVSGWPPGPVIPYRLPELLAAPASEPVWICEGEKDANNVAALGLIATTNPGGAKVWQPELAQWFKGKPVVYIAEDNDAAGREHTRKIQAALTGIVPEIAVVTFPDVPEKDDVSDWLELGGTKKLLLARAEQARQRTKAQHGCITTVNLATVKPRALRWLWPGHLVRGGLELIAGTPEIGKSQVRCQYVACATTGRAWPNGMPGITPCRAIMLTAEDVIDRTLVPRLIAAGANLRLIEELKCVRRNDRDEMFLLSEDLDKLERLIRYYGDVGLVTIDPITAYMGHGKHFDSHRATDVRSQLSPLKQLAESTDVAFSAVTHPPKNASARALDHFIGSQAFIAAARIGHLCVEEMGKDDDGSKHPTGRRFFTNPKINIAARQSTLIYCIDIVQTGFDEDGTPIEAPVVRWEGETDITAEQALAAAKPTKARKSLGVQEFLSDILISGPVLRNTIVVRGMERGFSLDQLKRAKRALSVEAFRKKGLKSGPSYWAFPQDVPPESEKEEDEHE